jgi:hypothetical protein
LTAHGGVVSAFGFQEVVERLPNWVYGFYGKTTGY